MLPFDCCYPRLPSSALGREGDAETGVMLVMQHAQHLLLPTGRCLAFLGALAWTARLLS